MRELDNKQITSKDLVAIYKRTKLATAGEWKAYEKSDGMHIGTSWDHPQLKSPLPIVSLSVSVKEPHHRIHIDKEDAEFIAHARTDIPILLNEISRLKEDMQEISEIVSSFYIEQGGILLPSNLSPIAGELQVIHKIAKEYLND